MSDPEEVSGSEAAADDARKLSSKKEKSGSGFDLLSGSREKKEKKDKKKEKETRYAHLGDDSTGEEDLIDGKSPAKAKKSKPFMFGSAKKDKDKKKEVGRELSNSIDGKKKPKLKLIKSNKSQQLEQPEIDQKSKVPEESPIFGVPLEVATERHRSHDGIPLPVVVRQCVDYIEDQGLMQEGIYRSSGVKSKVNKLRSAFNSRQPVDLYAYEPAVVASVLKLFLRELPDPVLTEALLPKFEKVSAEPSPQKRREGIKQLVLDLPECNRYLVQWIFTHMMHVIQRKKFNKMNLQNVSIVLSPTMRISHRVLSCLFENCHILFDGIQLKKYIPPITTETGSRNLPESPEAIEEEIRKQESLLTDLHLQISSGAASKKVEEQIWEQQRIVTQLKRKLRMAKSQTENQAASADNSKPRFEPIDYEEELNFSLQTPAQPKSSEEEEEAGEAARPVPEAANPDTPTLEKDSPENTEETEHKVTVMVHRTADSEKADFVDSPEKKSPEETSKPPSPRKNSHVTVIKLGSNEIESRTTVDDTAESPDIKQPLQDVAPASEGVVGVTFKIPRNQVRGDFPQEFPLLPPPPQPTKIRTGHAHILRPTPASPVLRKTGDNNQLPSFVTSLSIDRSGDFAKSKSLPRGLPSNGLDQFSADPMSFNPFPQSESEENEKKRKEQEELEAKELELDKLELEAHRAKFEFEELIVLKSELERRKRAERKEMEELREELATMQTLYHYRTYSVDSSESSSEEGSERDAKEEYEELAKILKALIRDNKELEQKRQDLCQKIQEERAACVNLRVEIRVEQERKKIKKRRNITEF